MASADFENGPPLEGEHVPTTQLAAMNSAEKEKVISIIQKKHGISDSPPF
jgi:hypothetical protein